MTSGLPQAVPVNDSKYSQGTTNQIPNATTVTSPNPLPARVVTVNVGNPDFVPPIVEDEHVGICRRCRRVFERPPGVNDGQAQYYRCSECEKHRWGDIVEGSCHIM